MDTVVEVRDNASGIVREYNLGDIGDTVDDFFRYVWDEGNFSCDCNRRLFFHRAADEDEEDAYVCGDGAFSVKVRVGGELMYSEF